MVQIATTTVPPASGATGPGVGRRQAITADGTLWALFATAANSPSALYYSKDGGATWTLSQSLAGVTEQAALFIDLDDNLHIVWRHAGGASDTVSFAGGPALLRNYAYYTRGTPNAGRTAWTWNSSPVMWYGGGFGSATQLDIVAFRTPGSSPTTWEAVAVCDGSYGYVFPGHFTIDAAGSINAVTTDTGRTYNGSYTNNTYALNASPMGSPPSGDVANGSWPTIDFRHTGDGKTVAGGSPDVYVAWQNGNGQGVRMKKATYSAGVLAWGTERAIDTTRYVQYSGSWLQLAVDGTRVVIAGNVGANEDVMLYERDLADTTTTATALIATPAAGQQFRSGSFTYDSAGNLYFVGVESGQALGWRKWTRASGVFGARTNVDAAGGQYPWAHLRRGPAAPAVDVLYQDYAAASPYPVVFLRLLNLNVAPNASGGLTPASGTLDRTAVQRLSWTFSDPDAGDTQSAFDLQWRVGAGAWTTVSQGTPNTYYDAPAGTFPAGTVEWQVRTYDAAGLVGPWSGSAFFTAASPPAAPAITAPINGSVVASNSTLAAWTTAAQTDYQVRTVADNAGAPNTATIYTDTGIVTDAAARTRSVTFDTNNRYEHLQVRVRNNGLWSTWASVRVQISFTPPPAPSVVTAVNASQAAIAVTITNPAPAGGEPALAYNDLYRRVAGVGSGVRVGTGLPAGVFTDRTPASGVAYQYLARAVATNGTTRDSAWTA